MQVLTVLYLQVFTVSACINNCLLQNVYSLCSRQSINVTFISENHFSNVMSRILETVYTMYRTK